MGEGKDPNAGFAVNNPDCKIDGSFTPSPPRKARVPQEQPTPPSFPKGEEP